MPNREDIINHYKGLLANGDIDSKILAFQLLIELQDDDLLKEFLTMYQDELFENKTNELIDSHIAYFLLKDDVKTAKEVLEEYRNKPFVSMDVESFMDEMDGRIAKYENLKTTSPMNEDAIYSDFNSGNEDKIARAFYTLSKLNIRQSLSLINNLLSSDIPYRFKALILFVLIDQKVDATFNVFRDDKSSFSFNGANSKFPFDKDDFIAVEKYYDSLNESPSALNLAKEMIKVTETMHYPDSLFDLEYDPLIIAEMILHVVKNELGEESDPFELSSKTGLSLEECEECLTRIQQKMS